MHESHHQLCVTPASRISGALGFLPSTKSNFRCKSRARSVQTLKVRFLTVYDYAKSTAEKKSGIKVRASDYFSAVDSASDWTFSAYIETGRLE